MEGSTCISTELTHSFRQALTLLCKTNIPFTTSVQFTGNLFVTIDTNDTFGIIVNEQISKNDLMIANKQYSTHHIDCAQTDPLARPSSFREPKDDLSALISFNAISSSVSDELSCNQVNRLDVKGISSQNMHFGSEISSYPTDSVMADPGLLTNTEHGQFQGQLYQGFTNNEVQNVANIDGNHEVDLKETKSASIKKKQLYTCSYCSAAFTRIGNFQRHMEIHSNERPYKCEICSATFKRNSYLKKHKIIHTNLRPYDCKICGATFAHQSNLKTHLRIHTNERPYQCDICFKSFAHNSDVKKHKRIHSKEKPFKCDICSMSFSESGNLKKHLRRHTGDKPFHCEICLKSFAQKGCLQRHQRLHTDERPYQCSECGASFRDSSSLQWHKNNKYKTCPKSSVSNSQQLV